MTVSPDLSLAEIVDTVPGAPRVFESYGLDYCCGGRRTLREACNGTGLDAAAVSEGLDALDADRAPDWVPMSPALLVDHLERTHHAYLRVELPRLVALSGKVADHHGDRHPELFELRRLCSLLHDDLVPHMAKEEQVLFPMIRELAEAISPPSFHCGSVVYPISRMLQEHEHTGDLLGAIRFVIGGHQLPDDACGSYRALYESLAELEADTHLHIHKENNTLFPAVIEMERRWQVVRVRYLGPDLLLPRVRAALVDAGFDTPTVSLTRSRAVRNVDVILKGVLAQDICHLVRPDATAELQKWLDDLLREIPGVDRVVLEAEPA